MRVACLQLSSGDRVEANLAVVSALLDEAAAKGAKLALLPEMFAFFHPDDDRKRHFAEVLARQVVLPFLADQARRHALTLIGGSLLLPGEGELLRNTCVVFSADGEQVALYDKIHLFDGDLPDRSYHESARIQPGSQPVVLDLEDWLVGLSICYDLRFPELYRHYAALGAQLLCIPSAFTVPTGQAHWELLLRARAVENQAYVLAAAQIGRHPGGRETFGHSMIVDPWGLVVAQATNQRATEGEVVLADIDLQRVHQVRKQLPALTHRRLY
ncbi:carbon-nitrogen hydrolase family protein [Geoalkalibacter halelectricus]|uniref:Carbon-nitrogen hydrolase family protein n=1 Tax=Geoalkalibacter halelectricus TaxID=2847045 RepID=A0ABY5ZGU4_9BACT|nr:carbon-nitrogen hydrolase family protein [Geoalkalibacter halelectricus]UWZ78099.1 carbon-nitrogen hydrolase family protein [Geoalkalibacter halelectricus]